MFSLLLPFWYYISNNPRVLQWWSLFYFLHVTRANILPNLTTYTLFCTFLKPPVCLYRAIDYLRIPFSIFWFLNRSVGYLEHPLFLNIKNHFPVSSLFLFFPVFKLSLSNTLTSSFLATTTFYIKTVSSELKYMSRSRTK
jgi:hypothetical protein